MYDMYLGDTYLGDTHLGDMDSTPTKTCKCQQGYSTKTAPMFQQKILTS